MRTWDERENPQSEDEERKELLTLCAHQLTDVATNRPVGSHSTSVAIKCSAWFMQVASEVS